MWVDDERVGLFDVVEEVLYIWGCEVCVAVRVVDVELLVVLGRHVCYVGEVVDDI